MFVMLYTPGSSAGLKPYEIEKFTKEFSRISKLFGKKYIEGKVDNISIDIRKLPGDIVGVCYANINRISLDIVWLNISPIEEQEEVVFHELAHCVMGKGHTPTGIMKAKNPQGVEAYRKNYKFLINELFDCPSGDCVDIQWDGEKYK